MQSKKRRGKTTRKRDKRGIYRGQIMFIQLYEEKFMRFPQGKEKALTFSYDDGVQADKKLIALFAKYGFKGTFNLNSELFGAQCWHGRMDEQETFSTFADCGQEIALHGARHTFLNRVPLAEAIKEITDCRAYLEGKFSRIVTGMAYAYNGYTKAVKDVLPALGVDYARTTLSTHSFALPEDWLEWNPTCKHSDKELFSLAEKFINLSPAAEPKNRQPLLFYIWGHSFEFDDDGNWDIVENLGKTLGGRSDVWYATNGEIYAYCKAYSSLVFSLDGERVFNPSAQDVWLELRGKVYKIAAGATVAFDKPERV